MIGSARIITSEEMGGMGPLISRMAQTTVLSATGGESPGSADGIAGASVLLSRMITGGELEGIGFDAGGKISGVLLWQRLPWDTSVAGVACARIIMLAGEGKRQMADCWVEEARSKGIVYATARFPKIPVRGEGEASALEKAGFSILERIVYYIAPCREKGTQDKAEPARPKDADDIGRIASESFSFDRFHGDPFFSTETADRIHREWALNNLSGRADSVLVVRGPGGEVEGYSSISLPGGYSASTGWIDMLAVSPARRRKGLGRTLILAALGQLRTRGMHRAALCTQDKNLPALALYERTGFSPFMRAVTYRICL